MSVVSEAELQWEETQQGNRFACRRKTLGRATGGAQLGASLYEVPPGKAAFPYHAHYANEEAIFILEGVGTLRTAEGEREVRKGDYIALLAGGDKPHQLWNSGASPLRYLCVSTMHEPEVLRYPDSGKLGVMAGSAPVAMQASAL